MSRIAVLAATLAVVGATAMLVTTEADARRGPGTTSTVHTTPRIDVAAKPTIKLNPGTPKIDVTPRIKRDLGLHVTCRYVPKRDKLGVVFMQKTKCYLM